MTKWSGYRFSRKQRFMVIFFAFLVSSAASYCVRSLIDGEIIVFAVAMMSADLALYLGCFLIRMMSVSKNKQ